MKVRNVDPQKAGFKPTLMMQAQMRGRVYDPNQIISVEVRITSDDAADLDSLKAYELARNAARSYLPGNTTVTPKGIGHRAEGYSRTYTVAT